MSKDKSVSAMEEELKPCLLCGQSPDAPHENDWCEPPEWSVHHRCPKGVWISAGDCETKEDAIAAWNRALPAAPAGEALRPEVMAFARLMETVLRQNDHKGGWKECEPDWLANRVLEEAAELKEAADAGAIHSPPDKDEQEAIAREAADVANFAMMIADVCSALDPYKSALHPAAAQEEGETAAIGSTTAWLETRYMTAAEVNDLETLYNLRRPSPGAGLSAALTAPREGEKI